MIRLPVVVAAILIMTACGQEKTKPAEHSRDSKQSQSPARSDSLLSSGREKYQQQDFSGARALWYAALATAQKNTRAEADLYTWLGLSAWRLGDLDSARVWQMRAIGIKSRLPRHNDLWRSYNALGLLVLSEARNDSAATLFERALKSAADDGDDEGVAKATGNAALAYTYLGDLKRARVGHQTMRSAGAQMRDARVEANGLANEAMVDIWEGDAATAIARLDTARRLYKNTDAVGKQNAFGQLASAYEMTGNYGAAFSALDSALGITRVHSLREGEVEVLRMLGGLHLRLGDEARASKYFTDAEAVARKSGVDADLGSILRSAAIVSLRLGSAQKARRLAADALRLHLTGDEKLEQIDDLLALAEVDMAWGRRDSAAARLTSAESLAKRLSNPSMLSVVLLANASIADRTGRPSRVLAQLRELRADNVRSGFDVQSAAAALATRAYLRLGAVDSAIASGARAVRLVERVRGGLAGDPIRSAYVADRAAVYGDYIVALLRGGRTEEAFGIADRARSRALLERLTLVGHQPKNAMIPPDLVESERLLKRIDVLIESLRNAMPPPAQQRARAADATAEIVSRLRAARLEYEQLLIRSEQRNSEVLTLLGAHSRNVSEIKRALLPDELLVEYFVARDTLLTFAVSQSSITVIARKVPSRLLAQRIRLLDEFWGTSRPDWREGLAVSRALYADLVAPLDSIGVLRRARHVVVVPHGMLGQVPFAGLQNPMSGRYLMQSVALQEAPSSSALVALRRPSAHSEPAIQWAAFAPFPTELPGTVREVAAFRTITPRSDIRLGREATESSVRAALLGREVVHIATHGVLNYRNPMFSRIELARSERIAPDDDGRLEVRELLALRIGSPLVFLSGCETGAFDGWTGTGFDTTGDLALSQAFLSAGAQNVVSTLWRIDDAGAAVLGARFYRQLQYNSVTDALVTAQREMAADSRFSNPYYWAGHVLSGEGRFQAGVQKSPRLP